ncbi:hypothetical protein RB195_016722 [Necator americanus]|uniref:Metalloendopeptidase n=1 Tax=Necator americanus TaxID=51031 RepID=A0ABR1C1T7_NECAM
MKITATGDLLLSTFWILVLCEEIVGPTTSPINSTPVFTDEFEESRHHERPSTGIEVLRFKRQALKKNETNTWKDGIVEYFFDSVLEEKTKKGFLKAAAAWEKDTCVKFQETKETTERVCESHVGKLGGKQPLFLGEGCESFGHAAHEIGHALGLFHTQNRHDRDKYIDVIEKNIKEVYKPQYVLKNTDENDNYGLPYDYGSIMHYGSPLMKPVMVPKQQNYAQTIGSPMISLIDLQIVNKLYNCDGVIVELHYKYDDSVEVAPVQPETFPCRDVEESCKLLEQIKFCNNEKFSKRLKWRICPVMCNLCKPGTTFTLPSK